jgi:hypothetical protein
MNVAPASCRLSRRVSPSVRGENSAKAARTTRPGHVVYLVSTLKPRIAFTSIGWSPRKTGRNFQLVSAARTLEVIGAPLPSRTYMLRSVPERSSMQAITRRDGFRLAGKSECIGCGAIRSSA